MDQEAAKQALYHVENGNNREAARILRAILDGDTNVAAGEQADAIADLDLSGTYGDDDDDIEAAVNGILAALRSHGIVASS